MDNEKLFIKLINHLTGEVTEVEVTSADQAKNLFLELSASETVIKKAKDSLRNYLDQVLGSDLEDKAGYRFLDGHVVRRVQRTQLIYRFESVKKYLQDAIKDKDIYAATIDSITKLDQKATDDLLIEMQDRDEIPHNTLKKIRDEADMKATKEYIEVR